MNNNLTQFNTRLLIIPFLILMVLTLGFTIYIDYAISVVKNYCNNLMEEFFSGDLSIFEEEDGDIAVLACFIMTQQNSVKVKQS